MSMPRIPAVDETGAFVSEIVKDQIRALVREVLDEHRLTYSGDGLYTVPEEASNTDA